MRLIVYLLMGLGYLLITGIVGSVVGRWIKSGSIGRGEK
jgi:hypothetical protein